jgi:hypothetical protein
MTEVDSYPPVATGSYQEGRGGYSGRFILRNSAP